MTKLESNLESWWDWYSQSLSFARADSEWNWIQRIANETRSSNPVINVQVAAQNSAVAGYCLLSAGGLAIHGGITQRSMTDLPYDSYFKTVESQADLKAICLEQLIVEAFKRQAELYQALIPIPKDQNLNSEDSQTFCKLAGMAYLTKLVRMENRFPFLRPTAGKSSHDPRLSIQPFGSVPYPQWVELLERTYKDSLDVPEIAPLRSTQKAIEGYRANCTPGVEGWYVIRCNGTPAGCLILSRHYHPTGEISYLGLAPEFRSQGYSFGIMGFALDWMDSQKCSKVALAVDCRNEVALSVYQNWGFQATISFDAWMASSKTYKPTLSD